MAGKQLLYKLQFHGQKWKSLFYLKKTTHTKKPNTQQTVIHIHTHTVSSFLDAVLLGCGDGCV